MRFGRELEVYLIELRKVVRIHEDKISRDVSLQKIDYILPLAVMWRCGTISMIRASCGSDCQMQSAHRPYIEMAEQDSSAD